MLIRAKKFVFGQTAARELNTLTPTKAARSAEDYLDFGLKGMLSSSGPVAYALAIFLYLQGRCQPMPPHLCSHSLFFTKGMALSFVLGSSPFGVLMWALTQRVNRHGHPCLWTIEPFLCLLNSSDTLHTSL